MKAKKTKRQASDERKMQRKKPSDKLHFKLDTKLHTYKHIITKEKEMPPPTMKTNYNV